MVRWKMDGTWTREQIEEPCMEEAAARWDSRFTGVNRKNFF